ncbi:hypothetical protein MKX01_010767 [Papaver californicum]|nr:hypothetical protein MKX01_010767 [Papaver californicum]
MVACLNPGEYQESVYTVSLAARSRHFCNYASSVQNPETPKVKVDMEEKLRAWLESKGKTKSTKRTAGLASSCARKTPIHMSSLKKRNLFQNSGKTTCATYGRSVSKAKERRMLNFEATSVSLVNEITNESGEDDKKTDNGCTNVLVSQACITDKFLEVSVKALEDPNKNFMFVSLANGDGSKIAERGSHKDLVESLNSTEDHLEPFNGIHQGFIDEALVIFLKARDWNVAKARKMLVDFLNWSITNEIDSILTRNLGFSADWVHDQEKALLIFSSNFTFTQGLPIFAIGVGQMTFDKAFVHYYVQSHIQINEYRDRVVLLLMYPNMTKKFGRHIGTCVKVLDMTGLKLSALSQIKYSYIVLSTQQRTVISTIDDLNYPEKTDTYYVVNIPYIFSAYWKVVKPLLQERTRKKIQVLQGCGRDELLKIIDLESIPHFCRKEGSGSSRHSSNGNDDCFSLDHSFHQVF